MLPHQLIDGRRLLQVHLNLLTSYILVLGTTFFSGTFHQQVQLPSCRPFLPKDLADTPTTPSHSEEFAMGSIVYIVELYCT